MRGIIVKGIGGLYTVMSDGKKYECSARGKFRQKGMLTPVIGDRVEFSVTESDGCAIEKIFERESFLIRPNVANVNQLLITFAAVRPKPDLLLADKLTVAAAGQGIKAVICITKGDLGDAGDYRSIYEKAGFETIVTGFGLKGAAEELDKLTRGKITALAGCSGVGKSTLINSIQGAVKMETGDVSRKTERGRHTTRHAELLTLENGGYILDTPGFSSFEATGSGRLSDYFQEFAQFEPCRFSDCAHINEPGCEILNAVKEGKIAVSRYESYVKILNEQKERERYR